MGMTLLLGKLFNVRSGEWRRLSLLYAMSLVSLTGLTWADTIVEASFLQRVGVQYLPWVIVICSAFSIGSLFLYTAFADRTSNTRLLIAVLGIGGIGLILGLAALGAGLVVPAYLLLYLVLQVPLLDVYNVHWATYVNDYYDIRAAKRIVPVLGTASRVSGIVAGLSMPLMNRLFDPSGILAISVFSLGFMALMAAIMSRLMREQGADRYRSRPATDKGSAVGARGQATDSGGYAESLREGFQQVRGSPFLRWLALSTLSMTVLLVLLNYATSAVFQEQLKTTVAISDFVGVMTGIANIVVLPFHLFVLSRLITRLGLGNANLMYPLTSLASAGALAVSSSVAAAGLGYLNRTQFRSTFRTPTNNLLYNAVPQRVKARARAFVSGLVVPIGSIACGLLLLTPLIRTPWFLRGSLLVAGLAFAATSWMVRKHYGKALVDLLEQEDYSSLALQPPSEEDPASLAADPATLTRLADKLRESTSPERTLFLAQLVTAVGGEAAVPIVGQAARTATDSSLRASLVEVLVAADVRKGDARELFTELLADPDPGVRLAAIGGLEQIDGPHERRFQDVAGRLLGDPEIEVRLRVLPALMMTGDSNLHAAASAELRRLLKSPDPHTRARAVRVVGAARAFGFLLELVRALTDEADEVRLAGALATEALAEDESLAGKRDMLLALALLLLHDPVERARVAAVSILDRLSKDGGPGASAARESAVAGLADTSAEVRQRAVGTLVAAGRRVIPQVQVQLTATDPRQRQMAAIVLASIEPRKYGSLVLSVILNDNLAAIYRNLACLHALAGCQTPALEVLGRGLRERNTDLVDSIFHLLKAIRDPAAVDTIARALASPQPEVRANAAEALESLTAPQTAALITPLMEPDRPAGPRPAPAQETWQLAVPTPAAALRLLLSDADDTWQRTLAAAALSELSAATGAASDSELRELFERARSDPDEGVRTEVSGAPGYTDEGRLSLVGKLVRLKDLPFFKSMRVEQLRDLAGLCEEAFFPADARFYSEGDPGGTLYIVVHGRVAVEQERRKGSFARLATVEAGSYLGESEFFDNNCRTNSAAAIQDTRALKLRREPVIALARQQPDLSLELIGVLSDRLRVANERIVGLTRTEPERLHMLYDQLE